MSENKSTRNFFAENISNVLLRHDTALLLIPTTTCFDFVAKISEKRNHKNNEQEMKKREEEKKRKKRKNLK